MHGGCRGPNRPDPRLGVGLQSCSSSWNAALSGPAAGHPRPGLHPCPALFLSFPPWGPSRTLLLSAGEIPLVPASSLVQPFLFRPPRSPCLVRAAAPTLVLARSRRPGPSPHSEEGVSKCSSDGVTCPLKAFGPQSSEPQPGRPRGAQPATSPFPTPDLTDPAALGCSHTPSSVCLSVCVSLP